MRQTTRRLFRLAMALLTACAVIAAAAPIASAAPRCARADLRPGQIGAKALGKATRCMINRRRAAHGLRLLRRDHRLAVAARRHSRDMVAHRYFAHDSRSGGGFSARIAGTGWMRDRRSWSVGENLAWGWGTQATARQIVAGWMRSAPHRANILSIRFRVIGAGVAIGTPAGSHGGATFTTDFGS
jgi:uncharacterized protein YkwD